MPNSAFFSFKMGTLWLALFTGLGLKTRFYNFNTKRNVFVKNCNNNFFLHYRGLEKLLIPFFKETFGLGAKGWSVRLSHCPLECRCTVYEEKYYTVV